MQLMNLTLNSDENRDLSRVSQATEAPVIGGGTEARTRRDGVRRTLSDCILFMCAKWNGVALKLAYSIKLVLSNSRVYELIHRELNVPSRK